MSDHAMNPSDEFELQIAWEGPALLAPGVVFQQKHREVNLIDVNPDDTPLDVIANWVAIIALSGWTGHAAHEKNKARVRNALIAWSHQKGPGWLNTLKQGVVADMMKHQPNGKLTKEQLLARINGFFSEIQG
jgi:hypothetical protein